ncbi:retrovirus-related pol polyprotein from transposon TNT 1-94 [Tanacetum coccineum]|uniref:Retrovirus-related pol polyprotein from transposon TNT 1-94 n=1 Tax=Tanacetum coccineum TaxID=301880 RepID=A0ABQ5E5R1_9ASTR
MSMFTQCWGESLRLQKSGQDEHKKEWFNAMQDEMKSLYENNTFELTKLPKGKRALKNKWVYKLKTEELYSRLMVQGQIGGLKRFGDDDFIILLLYVDDMLIVGKNIGRIAQLKQDLSKSFAMKYLGPAKQILGIWIFRDRGAKKLHISQEQYVEKVLRRFNMDKAKVVSSPLTPNFKLIDKDCPSSKKNIEKMDRVLYASMVGSLMYAMVCTRPDLAHEVGVVSRFLSNPDLAGNKDNMKSTFGYLMTFTGGAVSWQSRLQKYVALSTTEAEYVAAMEACKELLWLKRTKHIDIRYHWIRDSIEDGMFELNKVHTDDNAFDMLTKAVAREKLKICCSFAGMANSSS